MAVSLIRTAESHTGTTGSASQASYTFGLGQAGDTPKGVVVFTMQGISATEAATAVTYGGQSLSKVDGGSAADTVTEPGRVTAWFLGTGLPTGAQSVVVTRTNNTTTQYAVGFILASSLGIDTRIVGTPVLQEESAAMTAVTIDDGLASGTSIVLAGGYSGDNTPAPAGDTGTTTAHTLGGTYAYSFGAGYETTPTYGSRSRGLAASNDDRAQVVLAVSEVPILAVTSVTPSSGREQGVAGVVIAGTAFTGATAVTVGGHNASSYNVDSSVQITATFAAHAPEANLQVQVTTSAGSSPDVAGDNFTYIKDRVSIERDDNGGGYSEQAEVSFDLGEWTDVAAGLTDGHTYTYKARRLLDTTYSGYSNTDDVAYSTGPAFTPRAILL